MSRPTYPLRPLAWGLTIACLSIPVISALFFLGFEAAIDAGHISGTWDWSKMPTTALAGSAAALFAVWAGTTLPLFFKRADPDG